MKKAKHETVIEQLQLPLTEVMASGVYKMCCIERSTSLRRGGVLGLKRTDMDWKYGIIAVRR